MKKEKEYAMIQEFLIGQAAMLEILDLRGFVEAASLADSAGWVLDPTLYKKGHRRLEAIKDLAFAAMGYVSAFKKLNEVVEKERG